MIAVSVSWRPLPVPRVRWRTRGAPEPYSRSEVVPMSRQSFPLRMAGVRRGDRPWSRPWLRIGSLVASRGFLARPGTGRSPREGIARSRVLRGSPGSQGPIRLRRGTPSPGALLVGVTKYEHLPQAQQLDGPANDVRLMRRLLQEAYKFPAEAIISLTEDEGSPARRPTRANIEREFQRLADQARDGDQVVILLAGHGSRQPESNPPDPERPEPDGIDEIFLPADIGVWKGFPERVPKAIVDNEIGAWLRAITARGAYVWAIFDCCHSGTMTRGTEVVRELPPEMLVPREELEKAGGGRPSGRRGRAAGRRKSPPRSSPGSLPITSSRCTPAGRTRRPRRACSRRSRATAESHGLLTYTLVKILTKSAESKAPLTYRELVQRLQVQYAGRPQGSPTPLVEGKGQDRIVLGTEQRTRSPLLLTRDRDGYKVNAGDLYGLTPGSILAVDSPAGTGGSQSCWATCGSGRPSRSTRPSSPCAYEGSALVTDLAPFSNCRPVFIDYGLRRFKVAIQTPEGEAASRRPLQEAVQPLADAKGGWSSSWQTRGRRTGWCGLTRARSSSSRPRATGRRSPCRRQITRRCARPCARAWRRSTGPAT